MNHSEHSDPITAESVLAEVSDSPRLPGSENESTGHEGLSWTGWLSWMVILSLTAFIILSTRSVQQASSQRGAGDAPAGELIQVRLQGKVLVGQRGLNSLVQPDALAASEDASEAGGENEADESEEDLPLSKELKQVNAGTYEQRIAYTILVNELSGSATAVDALEDLDALAEEHDLERTENQQRLRQLAGALVTAQNENEFSDDVITDDDRQFLKQRLGWVGELAVVPAASNNQQQRTGVLDGAVSMLVLLTVGILAGVLALFVGLGLLITFYVKLSNGTIDLRFNNRFGVHNIYIETFAVWMLVFFGAQFAVPLLGIDDEQQLLMLSPVIAFVTLIALAWPVVRGIPWQRVLHDIGLKTAEPVRDILLAPLAYMTTLPIVALAVGLVTLLLILSSGEQVELPEFSPNVGVSHPVQEHIAQGKPGVFLAVILAACVAAPIVEEIMFRGVLYRHLRDWSAKWGTRASIVFSAGFNGLIFAAIHPQGLVAIPLLMSLAIAFSVVREWRGTLYPGMVMHAINNGLVTCLMFSVL